MPIEDKVYTPEELKSLQGVKLPAPSTPSPTMVIPSTSKYDQGFIVPEDVNKQQSSLSEYRAQNQGSLTKLGSGLINTVTGTALDLVGDVGYLLDTDNYTNFQKSSEEGFNNWLSDWTNKTKEDLKLPIYRTEESKGFSPTSAGWWADNMPSIASTVSMIVPTEAAVMGLSKIGELLGGEKLIQGIQAVTGVEDLSGTLKGITGAAISRHMESLMEGGQTFQDTYTRAIQAGKTEDEAKTIAGDAASTNYKLNWAAIVQDLPEYMMLHKTFQSASSAFSKEGATEALKIAGIEGSEEAYQFITDKEAQRNALINGKVIKDDTTSFSDRMINYSKDGDFWTSAFLGAIGGAGFGLYGVHKDNTANTNYNAILEQHKGILTGDKDTYYRGADASFNDLLSDKIADGTTQGLKDGLKFLLSSPERVKDEDRSEVINRINQKLKDIDYAESISKDAINDTNLTPDLKKLNFVAKLNQRSSENRLQGINQELNSLKLKDSASLELQPDISAYKEAKLTLDGIKNIPNLSNKVKELTSNINSVGKELLKVYPQFKTIDELNQHIISSNDNELTKLLTNKEVEKDIINATKEVLYKSKTDIGKQDLQDKIDKAKKAQEKEVKEKIKKQEEAKQDLVNNNNLTNTTPITKDRPLDINKELDKIDQQEDAEIENLYNNNLDNVEELSKSILAKYAKKREALRNKQSESVSNEIDNTKQEEVTNEEPIDYIDESPSVINSNQPDNNQGRTPDTVFKDNNGTDGRSYNSGNKSSNIYYNTTEHLVIDGHRKLIVTKEINPKLYNEILSQDPTALSFERKNPNYKGIWTVLVDKNDNIIKVDNSLVQSTLETPSRIERNEVRVDNKTKSIDDINNLRKSIESLKNGEEKYLLVDGKSKGLSYETNTDNTIIHSAFEKRVDGIRPSYNVLGRIFDRSVPFKSIDLQLVTQDNISINGVITQKGKLYTTDNNGRVFDLLPRIINDNEVDTILSLIHQELSKDKLVDSPIDEIKKIISFKSNKNDPTYQIYINNDNKLTYGSNGSEFSLDDFKKPEELAKLKDFLSSKRVNVNNNYLKGQDFHLPSINGIGDKVNYSEYLLSGDKPMFGTDLKTIDNPDGSKRVRFIQTYLTFSPILESKRELKTIDSKEDVIKQDKIINDNLSPIVEEVKQEKKVFTKRSRSNDEKLDRLDKIAKDRAKLSQTELNWFKSSFPNVPIEKVYGLIQNKSLGRFIDSGYVLLSDQATTGTLYHEAYHITSQLYLTRQENDNAYNEVRSALNNKDLTNKEAEEILAEDFINYKNNGEILKSRPVRNTIFRKLLNFVKDLIKIPSSSIEDIYRRLDKGYYTNAKVVGLREFSSLNRDTEDKRITKEKGTKFVNDVLQSLDVAFFDYIYEKGRTPIAAINNVNKVTNWIYDDFVEDYQQLTNKDQINDYEYILENWDPIIKLWANRINLNGVELKLENEEERVTEDEGLIDSFINEEEENRPLNKDAYQEGNLTSTIESISSPVRMLIRSLKQVNNDLSLKTNDLGRPIPVDFTSTYNYLLKNVVGNGSSYENLYNKIESLIQFKPEFRELLDRLGKPSDSIDDEHMDMQTQFTQAFNKNKTNTYITQYSPTGNYFTIEANRQNEADRVQTQWESNIRYNSIQDTNGNLKIDTKIIDIKNNIDFLNKLGINFSNPTIKAISDKSFNKTDLNESVASIKNYIEYHKGDITNLFKTPKNESKEDKKFNSKGRIAYLLNLEAQYTDNINELSYISADNKTEYSVGENNSLSVTVNIINNSKSKSELFSNIPHLNTLITENSVWINELFDPTTGIRNNNIKINLESQNGYQSSSDSDVNDKYPTRKGSKGDLYTQQIVNLLNGRSSYIVSADKSSEYTLSISGYEGNKKTAIPIESFRDSFNSLKLKSIFQGYFKSEFKRIAKYELDSLGKDKDGFGVDIYNDNGGKWTIFNDGKLLTPDIKAKIKNTLAEYKKNNISYADAQQDLDNFVNTQLKDIDNSTIKFFESYFKEVKNDLEKNNINDKIGFPKEYLDKGYTTDQLIRSIITTDFINSVEQTKLFTSSLAFYKDLYKRTSMSAGTKQIPRIDEYINRFLTNNHPRKDGKVANGFENTIVYGDVKTTKEDLKELIDEYVNSGFTPKQAYDLLGFDYNEDNNGVKGQGAYGKYDEADAMGYSTLDFDKEFSKRLGTWTNLQENAYNKIQKQKFDSKGNLIEGELLTKDEIALFLTKKLQYAGPIQHGSTSELFVPGGYKFTTMPLIPQMVAGKNLSKILDRMSKEQAGISVFKSGSKFGTIVNKDSKPNKFYSQGNHGDIYSGDLIKQIISYQYLGLQVKPSEPHDKYIFSTQFRKTIFIDAFSNGKENFKGASELLKRYTDLIDQRTTDEKNKLIKELGINPESKSIEDATKLVEMLVKSSEERKLPNNIIDSLDVEEVNGIKQLKYSIDSMVNKPKIDSILMSLINSRLIKQKVNGEAYVLASVTGMEKLGNRPSGTNPALRSYSKGEDGKTLPAEVMVPLGKNYNSLLNKYKTLKGVNDAIKEGKIDKKVLELVACRIPGQGMNSNEYLTIKEFLPEDSGTTMIAHPEIVAKAGSDFDNDKLYTYRATIDKEGNYIEDNIDNKVIDVIKETIANEHNFLSLITPNSTNIITPIVNDIKYNKYVNNKKSDNEQPTSLEKYVESFKLAASNIKYTDLLKLNKKVSARYKLWLAKDMVGLSAIANAYGPLSQIGDITANKEYNTGKLDKEGKEIIEKVTINLPHNEVEDKLNMSATHDALNINKISEINNQLINIIVDAAKDEEPMVSFLNMTMDTLPIYMYLNRLGVPFEYTANFMVQPIISDYINKVSTNKSIFLKVSKNSEPTYKIVNSIKSDYQKSSTTKDKDDYINKELNLLDLKKYQLDENKNGKEYDLFQLQVLSDFLAYKDQAKLFNDAVRLTNSDSSGLGQNINASRLKLEDFNKVKQSGFINGIENIIDKTFIKSFQQEQFSIDTYKDLYNTQKEKINTNILNLANDIEKQLGRTLSKNDKLGLVNLIENDFINYVIQNYGYNNIKQVRNSLFKGDNSVAKQLLALKNRVYNTKDILDKDLNQKQLEERKLVNNILVKELFPLIDKGGKDYDNIKIFTKRLDTFTSNQLTEAFRELKDSNLDLASKLMKLGILQSGLNNSPITYLGLIPYEYYNQLVKDSFNKFNIADTDKDLDIFNQLFRRNNWNNTKYFKFDRDGDGLGNGIYGKDYDKTNYTKFSDTQLSKYTNKGEQLSESNFREIADKLKSKFNVDYDIVSPEEALVLLKMKGHDIQQFSLSTVPAFYDGERVVIPSNYMTSEVAFHEYGHIFVDSILSSNKPLFASLKIQLQDSLSGREILDHIKKEYKELTDKQGNLTDKGWKEAITQALGELADNNLKESKDGGLIAALKRMLSRISEYLQSLFNDSNKTIKPFELQADTTLEELASYLNLDNKFDLSNNDNNKVNFNLKGVEFLSNEKATQLFNKFFKGNKDKFYQELTSNIGKEQVELIKDIIDKEDPKTIGDLFTSLLSQYSYSVEVNTTKNNDYSLRDEDQFLDDSHNFSETPNTNTSYYSNLIVPGGTNYTENEIKTPSITPSIKGYAQFSSDNGIGWHRSDDRIIDINKIILEMEKSGNLKIEC